LFKKNFIFGENFIEQKLTIHTYMATYSEENDGATETNQGGSRGGNFSTNWDEVCESFDDMDLKESLLRGIYAYGFEKPSQIQARAIKPVIMGKDTIAQAQSGTGKTGTFVISSLQIIDENSDETQVLIMAPTRELAQQIGEVAKGLSAYMQVPIHICVGGTNVRDDISAIRRGVHFVVGTPGRINDLINRNVLETGLLKLFVLDEADEMLSRGF
jgi:translation initiation factor 4A